MAYPSVILDAIGEKPCVFCHDERRPAHIVSIHMHLAADAQVNTGLRHSLNLICPCSRRSFVDLQLDRGEVTDTINELRHRGNRPPSRREPQQMFVQGSSVRRRHSAKPSNRTAPDQPFSDKEVADLLKEIDWFDLKIDSPGFAETLYELLKLYKPPPYEDKRQNDDEPPKKEIEE